ncbi:MAG: hypothetical protein GY790_00970 [Bacteroidetes bacterium]|nr:hypothetical protein [Bacteroidota bacterium]
MQRIALWVMLAVLMGACNQAQQNREVTETGNTEKIVAATIEELIANPLEYENKEVAITGMVTHVCKHGGQKCFVLAKDGETQIRLVPSGDIDEFKIDLEGSTIAIKGTLKVLAPLQTEAHLEDHESKEHHAVEMSHSEAEKAQVFIETLEFREITE